MSNRFLSCKAHCDYLAIMALSLWLAGHFLVELSIPIPDNLADGIFVVAIALMLIAELLRQNRYAVRDVGVAAIGILFVVSALQSDSKVLLQALIIVYLMRDVNLESIMRLMLCLLLSMLVITITLFFIGIMPETNLAMGTTRDRSALGFIWPSRAGNYLLSIVLAYICMKRERFSIWVLLAFGAVAYLVYSFTDARAPLLFTLLLIVACILVGRNVRRPKSAWIARCFGAMPAILAIVVIALHAGYDPDISWMHDLNSLASNRLLYSNNAFRSSPIGLFGTNLFNEDIAISGTTGYLDSGYLRLLMTYGAVPFFVAIVVLCSLSYRLAQRGEWVLLVCVGCVLIRSMLEGGFIYLQYSPILFLLMNGESDKRSVLTSSTIGKRPALVS